MTTTAFPALAPVAVPRGAPIAADLFAALLRLGARMIDLAQRQRERTLSMQRFRDAAELRHIANQLQATDPALAADLYAAADRHTIDD